MKNLYFILLLLTTIVTKVISQGCFPEGITFSNQNQIDQFLNMYSNCTEIEGFLTIERNSAINNVNGLKNIKIIKGDFHLDSCDGLTSLRGLENLKEIHGDFIVDGTSYLQNFDGLYNLEIIKGSFKITRNRDLKNCEGLESIIEINNSLIISENDSLGNLQNFESLKSVKLDLIIEKNENLQLISGFNDLVTVEGNIYIRENKKLSKNEGFNSLKSIEGQLAIYVNINLSSIAAFNELTTIKDGLVISNNYLLTNLNAFNKLKNINNIEICGSSLDNLQSLSNIQKDLKRLTLRNNKNMTSLYGLDSLTTIDQFYVLDCPNLDFKNLNDSSRINVFHLENTLKNDLTSLGNIDFVDHLHIGRNDSLTNFRGIDRINSMKFLTVTENNSLKNLDGLSTIDAITGIELSDNLNLENIEEIENLNADSLKSLNIKYNPNLSFCSIKSVCDFLGKNNDDSYSSIYKNKIGCNDNDEILNQCLSSSNDLNEDSLNSIFIYPNPATNYIICIGENIEQIVAFDITGKERILKTVNGTKYSLKNLRPGINFLVIKTNKSTILKKIIKK